jgi:hypothetical protein
MHRLIQLLFIVLAVTQLQNSLKASEVLNSPKALGQQVKKIAGWNSEGFVLRITDIPPDLLNQLEAQSDPAAVKWDQQGPFWKEIIKRISVTYRTLQREVNVARNLPANKLRGKIQDVFGRLLQMRGGGSVSWEMGVNLEPHVEWIIGHMDSGKNEIAQSDEKLLQQLLRAYPFSVNGASATDKRRVAEIISDLRSVEESLTPQQGAFLRREFAKFFAG